jgi:hypothetical protein
MASAIAAIVTTSVLVLALPIQAFAYVPPGVNQYGGGGLSQHPGGGAGLSAYLPSSHITVVPTGVNSGQVLTGQTYPHPSCTATHTCAFVLSGIALALVSVHYIIKHIKAREPIPPIP